ncbi:MAG: hypothetical protein AAF703_15580 [Cyanobacteria bacterium P01_D01_bin.105]
MKPFPNFRLASFRLASYGVASGGLLLGFLCLGRAIETALDRNPNRTEQRETITVGLLLGIPCTAGALWMLGATHRQQRLERSQRLQTIFYKAIKSNNGRIDPLQFAVLGQISVDEAQDCLEAWAQQLNADFKIDEGGVMVYCFDLPALIQRPNLPES